MTWSTVRLSAVPVPVAEPVQALMEQASVGGTGPGAAEQTTSGASPGSDPGKAALPAFQHGPLAFHPQTLPAAYPFGYWTGQVRPGVVSETRPKPWHCSARRSSQMLQSQGAPLVYGGPFYGGILPGMFQSPPAEAPKLGTREQAVVPGDAPEVWHGFAISICSQRARRSSSLSHCCHGRHRIENLIHGLYRRGGLLLGPGLRRA